MSNRQSGEAPKWKHISELRRSGTIIHLPSRRFTSGYQDIIRSGFPFHLIILNRLSV
jgi:hypothetical protein